MPTVRLDQNAYQILEKAREYLKNKGINADFSDAVRHLARKAGYKVIEDESNSS